MQGGPVVEGTIVDYMNDADDAKGINKIVPLIDVAFTEREKKAAQFALDPSFKLSLGGSHYKKSAHALAVLGLKSFDLATPDLSRVPAEQEERREKVVPPVAVPGTSLPAKQKEQPFQSAEQGGAEQFLWSEWMRADRTMAETKLMTEGGYGEEERALWRSLGPARKKKIMTVPPYGSERRFGECVDVLIETWGWGHERREVAARAIAALYIMRAGRGVVFSIRKDHEGFTVLKNMQG